MSRTWQPTAVAARPSSPNTVAAASTAAAESKGASLVSVETGAANATGLKFGHSVSLSEAHKRRQELVNITTAAARGIDHRTLAAVAESAHQLAGKGARFNAVVADGSVTREDVEAFIDDDVACSELIGITLVRSLRSTAALSALVESLVRDEPAYLAYCKKEEAQRLAEEERLRRAQEREAAVAAAGEQDEAEDGLAEDAEVEDLGPKPPKPTALRLATLALVSEAAAFADNSTAPGDISKLIEQSPALEQLRIAGCGVNGVACSQLAGSVLSSRSLTALDLADNGFGRDDEPPTEALATLLQQSKFLVSVNLADNDISPAMVKQLAEALATSDTRVATPEQDPEPEFEPWLDELPDPEEAPQQTVGYPPEDAPEAGGEPADADAAAEAAADAEVVKPEGDDEEDEEKEDDEEPAAADEEEIDEEEAERLAEERAEAERAAREEAEAAWREREEQYIWGPQRAHFEHDEHNARRAIMQSLIDETAELKRAQFEDRAAARSAQLNRERVDRERRSGWSHLKQLVLAGNPLGSEGASALAEALRSEIAIPRSDDAADEGDEGTAEDLAPEADEGEDEGEETEEGAEAEIGSAAGNKEPAAITPPTPPPTTKPGFATLTTLDVSRASIASKGMVALASVLADNCPSLTALNVMRNKFALKHKLEPVDQEPLAKADEDADDEAPPMKRVPVTDWVSPGVERLAVMLRTNRTLKKLNIGFNHLYPSSASAIFEALRGNDSLVELCVEGNPICHDGSLEPFHTLLSVLPTMTSLTHVNFANTKCADAIAHATTEQLASLFRLQSVNLGHNGLGRSTKALFQLSEAAKACSAPNVKVLSLEGNLLDAGVTGSHESIVSIVTALQRRIESFNLGNNPKIGDVCVRECLKALSSAPAIRTLNLNGTRVDVCVAASKFIDSAGYLESFDLGDTVVTDSGASDACAAATRSSSLKFFALWSRDHDASATVMNAFATAPPRSLTSIDCGCRPPTGTEPTEDSDHAFDIEDVENVLLRNRRRAFARK